ncbi:hypothetical protein [Tenacibaculum maritimum]|uniref:hypothetical protein n=1 Tax=Tenacibaculum maritimum TaxID=107401 RepID=UPI00388E2F4F
MKTVIKYILLNILILLISCSGKPTRESCDFNYFEETSKIKFPKEIEIINCGDSSEGSIWVHLQFSKKDAIAFIGKMNFHSYSSSPEYLENDKSKTLPIYPDNSSIETFELNMDYEYIEIPKNDRTKIATISKEKQYLTYILNIESGMFWGHIRYPDWSGDF